MQIRKLIKIDRKNIDTNKNLQNTVRKSSLVISQFSTSAFEVLKIGKPLIIYNFEKQYFSNIFKKSEFVIVENKYQLQNVLTRFYKNKKLKNINLKNYKNKKIVQGFFGSFNKTQFKKNLKAVIN